VDKSQAPRTSQKQVSTEWISTQPQPCSATLFTFLDKREDAYGEASKTGRFAGGDQEIKKRAGADFPVSII